MLVTFETKAYPPITMFGEVAKRLLRIMGMSGDVPGAIKSGDVREALARLRSGLAQLEHESCRTGTSEDGEAEEPAVDLTTRAFPLLELMSLACENGYDVMWAEKRV